MHFFLKFNKIGHLLHASVLTYLFTKCHQTKENKQTTREKKVRSASQDIHRRRQHQEPANRASSTTIKKLCVFKIGSLCSMCLFVMLCLLCCVCLLCVCYACLRGVRWIESPMMLLEASPLPPIVLCAVYQAVGRRIVRGAVSLTLRYDI